MAMGVVDEARREKRKASHAKWRAAHPGAMAARATAWQRANPERHRANVTKSRTTPTGRLRRAMTAARKRAELKGVPFTLDRSWPDEASKTTHCPLTGLAFDYAKPNGTSKNPLAPSIDRIDNSKGYTPDNVRVISVWANVAKNDLADDQFLNLILAAADTIRQGGQNAS